MAEITWNIVQMERDSANNGVVVAHWRTDAREETYFATTYGSVGFTPDPDSPDFVPFEELTEEVCVGWVKNALGAEQVVAIEDSLNGQIEVQKHPKVIEGLPWTPALPEPTPMPTEEEIAYSQANPTVTPDQVTE